MKKAIYAGNGCVAMEEKTSRKRQSFLHGALILTASIMIVKVIGALFKVPLTWIITEDGMGYFNTAYMFYSPLYSLATAGFPIAISRLVSESYTRRRFRDIRQIHRASIPIFADVFRRAVLYQGDWQPERPP